MEQQSNIIIQSSNNGISRVKLNEPSTYNALSLDTLKTLIECFKNFNDDEINQINKQAPLKKLAEAGDTARAIEFLISKENRYMTGCGIDISGGQFLSG